VVSRSSERKDGISSRVVASHGEIREDLKGGKSTEEGEQPLGIRHSLRLRGEMRGIGGNFLGEGSSRQRKGEILTNDLTKHRGNFGGWEK